MPRRSNPSAKLSTDAAALGSHALLSLEIAPGGALPKEVRLFKMGENDSTQGKFYFSERSVKEVRERASDWGNKHHFDWDHHAYLTMSKGVKAPAAAWYDLEVRSDGLYAVNIEWTPQGKKDVEDKAYRYLSPYFDFDEKTREVTKYNNAALTNLPALKQLEALTSVPAGSELEDRSTPPHHVPEAPMSADRKALLSTLGLADSASDAEVAARVASLNHFKAEMLKATGAKTEIEAMSGLLSMRSQADTAAALQKQLEAEKAESVNRERSALLSAAVAAGQLEPGSDLKKNLEAQPVELVKAMLSALPKKAGASHTPVAGAETQGTAAAAGTTTASATLSQEQLAAAKKSAAWFETDAKKLEEHWSKLAQQ